MGFRRGVANASCFYNPATKVRCVVHGDYFTFRCASSQLEVVRQQMQEVFLCKVEGALGSGSGDLKEARVLNRVL
eukprot:138069-Lingulodinium_polyedra.AAC.1